MSIKHAFPTEHSQMTGMELRDWFAGMALMSMLSPVQELDEKTHPWKAAQMSYKFADAMMEERLRAERDI